MLLSLRVLECFGANITLELGILEGLLGKPVQIFVQVEIAATVRASLIPLCPIRKAYIAAKLIALLALLGVLHDLEADCAGEVAINAGHSTLARQLLLLGVVAFADLALQTLQQGCFRLKFAFRSCLNHILDSYEF